MRIIENNYKGKERTIICPHCSSVIAYEWDSLDRHITKSGRSYICCGACHEAIYINENNVDNVSIDEFDETPTINTVQYPKDFYSFENAVPIKDDEVNKWVNECINDIDKDTDFSYRASGDTFVFAYKSDEDLPSATVIVAKKYQETDVKISRKNF
jgi:hypothetical protein